MTDVTAAYDAAAALLAAGRTADAEPILRAIVSRDPRHADALHLLAVAGYHRGNAAGAVPLLRRAVTIHPAFATAWNTLGECYRTIGRLEPAVDAYRIAIAHDPALAAAHSNLALALDAAGRPADAVIAARAAVAVDPHLGQAWSILATALLATGDATSAVAAADQGLAHCPAAAAVHNNRGAALERLDRLPDALAAYAAAADLDPASATIANNCTNVARQLNRYDEAMTWTRRALAADPHFGPARWALGLLQLTAGNYADGWANYEYRFAGTDQRHPPFLPARLAWDGVEDLSRGTLLVYAEQGFGDGFQIARYLPRVAQRVGRLVVLCHREQHRLLAAVPGPAAVVASGDGLPPFDRYAPMMSLPLLCGTRSLGDVPTAVPYLSPPPDAVDRWRTRLPPSPRLKVGLVWSSGTKTDPCRTCPWPAWADVLAVAGVDFYGLQIGPAAADPVATPHATPVTDLSPELTDFAETAAALAQLDLVITIDTAVAHLSGATARPTWTLVPFSPDWRYLLDRSDSPWYPTMRLYRQTERKRWADVMARVAADLRGAVAAKEPHTNNLFKPVGDF